MTVKGLGEEGCLECISTHEKNSIGKKKLKKAGNGRKNPAEKWYRKGMKGGLTVATPLLNRQASRFG